uniref:Uncharacterized protein n=1 Tax=Aegilops tauschii TaxID=37682 RepID=M8BMK8_AEGTA
MAAAVVGGMVASGVIKVVIRQIGSAIVGKVKLHKNLTKDLQKMKMTLGGGRAQRRREVVHHGQLGAPVGESAQDPFHLVTINLDLSVAALF